MTTSTTTATKAAAAMARETIGQTVHPPSLGWVAPPVGWVPGLPETLDAGDVSDGVAGTVVNTPGDVVGEAGIVVDTPGDVVGDPGAVVEEVVVKAWVIRAANGAKTGEGALPKLTSEM
jgi:hypothetical protein